MDTSNSIHPPTRSSAECVEIWRAVADQYRGILKYLPLKPLKDIFLSRTYSNSHPNFNGDTRAAIIGNISEVTRDGDIGTEFCQLFVTESGMVGRHFVYVSVDEDPNKCIANLSLMDADQLIACLDKFNLGEQMLLGLMDLFSQRATKARDVLDSIQGAEMSLAQMVKSDHPMLEISPERYQNGMLKMDTLLAMATGRWRLPIAQVSLADIIETWTEMIYKLSFMKGLEASSLKPAEKHLEDNQFYSRIRWRELPKTGKPHTIKLIESTPIFMPWKWTSRVVENQYRENSYLFFCPPTTDFTTGNLGIMNLRAHYDGEGAIYQNEQLLECHVELFDNSSKKMMKAASDGKITHEQFEHLFVALQQSIKETDIHHRDEKAAHILHFLDFFNY